MKKLLTENFYEAIGITEDMKRSFRQVMIPNEEYACLKGILKQNPESFCRRVRNLSGYRQVFLYLYLRLAEDAYEDYQKAGINDEIYFDTMKDIVIWAGNCYRDFGEWGIEEYSWIWRHVTLQIFKLGRLQFELISHKKDTICNCKTIKAGERMLNLHIPQGEPLEKEQCMKSLQRAEEFFGEELCITCHSWLLNPEMKELLNENSNILKFQELFYIYALEQDDRQAEERVFGKLKENSGEYPERTGLQRALKKYLLEGKKFGSAYGEISR